MFSDHSDLSTVARISAFYIRLCWLEPALCQREKKAEDADKSNAHTRHRRAHRRNIPLQRLKDIYLSKREDHLEAQRSAKMPLTFQSSKSIASRTEGDRVRVNEKIYFAISFRFFTNHAIFFHSTRVALFS